MPTYIKIITGALKIIPVPKKFFFIQTAVSFFVAVLNGAAMALWIPLIQGIVRGDYVFLSDLAITRSFAARLGGLPDGKNTAFFFTLLAASIMALTLCKVVCQYILGLYRTTLKGELAKKVRCELFRKYLSFGKQYFDKTSQGNTLFIFNLLDKILGIVDILNTLAGNTFALLVYVMIMFIISWKLALMTLVVCPILFYSTKWIVKKIELIAELQTKKRISLSKEIFNIISCVTLIKIYCKEEEMINKYRCLQEELKQIRLSIERKQRLIAPIQELIITAAVIIVAVFAAAYMGVASDPLRAWWYLLFIMLLRNIFPIFSSLSASRATFINLQEPIKAVLRIYDIDQKYSIPQGEKVFFEITRCIEFKDLTFGYVPAKPVLHNLSFTIEKGKATAIVGSTGAGKTTIVSLIMRLYDCPPASIFIDGNDIRTYTLQSLMQRIAFVSQDILLFNDTLKHNITFGLDGPVDDAGLIEVAQKARLYDFVMGLPQKFNTVIGDRGMKLSGGERQRVSIARALLKKTEILILDEATSALDTKTEIYIQQALEEAMKERTTIVIAHRLSTIQHCDKIIVIEKGCLIEEGTLDGLLEKQGLFYQYWEAQKFY